MDEENVLIQEFNDRVNTFETVQKEYLKNKLILDTVKECLTNDLFDENLRNKIKNILIESKLEQDESDTTQPLLGINLKKDELDYGEKQLLEFVVLKTLREKYDKVAAEFYNITGDHLEDVTNSKSSDEEEYLLETRATMLKQRELFLTNLQKHQELLEEIAELRTEKLQEVSEEKVKQYEVESQMNLLKVEVMENKMKTDIFMENNYSLAAYKTLIEDIKVQQENCREEIKNLENIKEKYKQVSCKQFDELLKTYKQYKSAIEKKRIICDNLNIVS